MISVICEFVGSGRAVQERSVNCWGGPGPVWLTGSQCCSMRHYASAAKQALLIQDGEMVLTEINQQRHLLVKGERLVSSLSQAKESFDEGLQAHP